MGKKREIPPQYSVFTERAAVLRQRVEEMAKHGVMEERVNTNSQQPQMPMLTQTLDANVYKQYCHFLLQQLERSKIAFDALSEEYCKLRRQTPNAPLSDIDRLLFQPSQLDQPPSQPSPSMTDLSAMSSTTQNSALPNDAVTDPALAWLSETTAALQARRADPPKEATTLPPFHGLRDTDEPILPGSSLALADVDGSAHASTATTGMRPNLSSASLNSLGGWSDKADEELLSCLIASPLMPSASPMMTLGVRLERDKAAAAALSAGSGAALGSSSLTIPAFGGFQRSRSGAGSEWASDVAV